MSFIEIFYEKTEKLQVACELISKLCCEEIECSKKNKIVVDCLVIKYLPQVFIKACMK